MKRWQASELGAPDTVLEKAEVPLPEPGPDEARVRVLAASVLQEPERPRYGPWSLHGELVRLHISEAQGAIATWLACRRPGGLDELVESEVTEQHLADIAAENDHDDSGYPTTLEELRSTTLGLRLALLRSALRYNLAPFSVGLGSLTDRQPSILSAAFLQLYNHLAEDATIRTCANETCGRDFVRQRGRA
ncbi:hypothetical protein [Streptomyces sp. NPDC052693]|uniref:hypothetical protein n=1 Tax=Streptomyces sp. NPDC052693 TaxID=3155814 RepID=UPI00343BCF98